MRELLHRLQSITGIVTLLLFTIVAVFGYLVFVVPPWGPENLARFAHIEWIPRFYANSFLFFAQAHILIGLVVLVVYLIRVDELKWLGAFAIVYVVSLCSELLGTSTGLPFGPYAYASLLGPKWLGLVPVLIPVSWFLMAVPSYVVAAGRFGKRWHRVVFGAFLLAAWDLALDPAMSYLTTYWTWQDAGVYYGMPLLNLVGWLVTGLALMFVLDVLRTDRLSSVQTTAWMRLYYFVTFMLPLGMIAAAGLWGGVIVTLCALVVLLWIERSGKSRQRSPADPPRRHGSGIVPSLSDVPVDLAAYFRQNSRSFSFAARFFSKADREKIGRLYAFCRITDDLVDEYVHDESAGERHSGEPAGAAPGDDVRIANVREALRRWRTLAEASYRGNRSGIHWLDTLMLETRQSGATFELVETLLAGVESDIDFNCVSTESELDAYAFKVGSVVGIWMCFLLGVRSPHLHDYAADLGTAMQITNILRDVGEDLDAGRIYLPSSLLDAHGISHDDLCAMRIAGTPTPEYISLIRGMMTRADRLYERAWIGLAMLPPRFGLAAAVASGVYRGIQAEIVRNGFDNLTQRAHTSSFTKVVLAVRSWRRLRQVQSPEWQNQVSQAGRSGTSFQRISYLSDEYHV